MYKWIKELIKDESGMTALTYALLGSLIVLAIVIAVTNLGTQMNTVFTKIRDALVTPSG